MDSLENYVNVIEADNLELTRERDEADYALCDMYRAVTGKVPSWTNTFNYDNAVDEVWSKSLSDEEAVALRAVAEYFTLTQKYTTPALDSAIAKLAIIIGDI